MNLNRRHFLRLSMASILYVGQLNAKSLGLNQEQLNLSDNQTLEEWLALLLPSDDIGAGGEHVQVIAKFDKLLLEPEFKKGISAGLKALELYEPDLDTQENLDSLMKQKLPEARFLTALYELLLESYYGQQCGWSDIGLFNPLIQQKY